MVAGLKITLKGETMTKLDTITPKKNIDELAKNVDRVCDDFNAGYEIEMEDYTKLLLYSQKLEFFLDALTLSPIRDRL